MTEQFQTGPKKPCPNNGATRARDLYVKLPIMKLTPEAALYAICHAAHSA